jgi:hypothetical protein
VTIGDTGSLSRVVLDLSADGRTLLAVWTSWVGDPPNIGYHVLARVATVTESGAAWGAEAAPELDSTESREPLAALSRDGRQAVAAWFGGDSASPRVRLARAQITGRHLAWQPPETVSWTGLATRTTALAASSGVSRVAVALEEYPLGMAADPHHVALRANAAASPSPTPAPSHSTTSPTPTPTSSHSTTSPTPTPHHSASPTTATASASSPGASTSPPLTSASATTSTTGSSSPPATAAAASDGGGDGGVPAPVWWLAGIAGIGAGVGIAGWRAGWFAGV